MTANIPHVLLVEDEDAHTELIHRAFEDEANLVNLTIARSLQEARNYLAAFTPDLVIVDFLLPDGKGTELLPAEKEDGTFPVVIMTSYGDEKVAVEAMKGGALDYVVKSDLSLAAMPRIVKRVLREWGYIVDRRRAEKEVHLLSTAIEQTAESILITDTKGTIIYVNSAFEQITGYSRAEAIGRTPNILKSGRQDRAFYQELWSVVSQGQVWHNRLINRRKDGTLYTADMTVTPVRDHPGNIVNYVSAQRDVTHELETEQRLRQTQKMEAIGQLAGGVAHDFNNILQAILGYTYMVKLSLEADNPGQEDLDQVIKATNRATTLVQQLLAFSRQETFQPKNLDLNDIIANLLNMLRRVIGEHINLEVHTQNDLKIMHADPGQIEQILMNLCVNARDAMPDGGNIFIQTANFYFDDDLVRSYPWAQEGNYILLSITDTGTGIPPQIQDRIFEPFFTTKEVGEGTGLGLATVYAIIKHHKGGINVYSEPGHGTTFQIYFPAVPSNKQKFFPEKRLDIPPVYGGTETILLAEDDDTLRELAITILEKAGYHVLAACDGEQAVELFEQHMSRIDLALLDAVMPKKSGRAVYDCIKMHQAKTPILFSTGYGYNVLKNINLPVDGVQLIRKPYGPRDLLYKVREALDRKSK